METKWSRVLSSRMSSPSGLSGGEQGQVGPRQDDDALGQDDRRRPPGG